MTDIPRAKDISALRGAFDIFMVGGFEALTGALRRGQPIRDVEDLTRLRARYSAFCDALEARLASHGIVIEDDGNE